MKTILMLLFFMSASVFANPMDEIIKMQDQKDAKLEIGFTDEYKMKMYGPITVKEKNAGRSMRAYDITYTDEKGQRQTRSIQHSFFGPQDDFEWTTPEGETYYVNSVTKSDSGDSSSTASNGPTPSKGGCQAVGKLKQVKIVPQKMLAGNDKSCPVNAVKSCMGDSIIKCEGTVECVDHPEYGTESYEIFCVGTDSSCPNIEKCMADTAYEEFEKENLALGFELKKENVKSSGKK